MIEPPSLCFSFNFNLLDIDLKSLEKELKKKLVPQEKQTPSFQWDQIFIELIKAANEVYSQAYLLPWYSEDGTKILGVRKGREDKLPKTSAALSPYFFSMQQNRVGQKWIKLRITSNNLPKVEQVSTKWARAESYSFSHCIVQAEKGCVIGWLVYSSQYTNIAHLGKCLKEKTDHE